MWFSIIASITVPRRKVIKSPAAISPRSKIQRSWSKGLYQVSTGDQSTAIKLAAILFLAINSPVIKNLAIKWPPTTAILLYVALYGRRIFSQRENCPAGILPSGNLPIGISAHRGKIAQLGIFAHRKFCPSEILPITGFLPIFGSSWPLLAGLEIS